MIQWISKKVVITTTRLIRGYFVPIALMYELRKCKPGRMLPNGIPRTVIPHPKYS